MPGPHAAAARLHRTAGLEPLASDADRAPRGLEAAKEESAANKAELARIEGERLAARFEAEAAGYKALAQDPKAFGKVLLDLHTKAPEAKKAIDAVLRTTNAALSASPLLRAAMAAPTPSWAA